MPVNEERMRLGIDGLRSGRYKKWIGALHRIIAPGGEPGRADTWCCLGGLSDVAIANGCQVRRQTIKDREMFGTQGNEFLSAEVMQWYGLENENPILRDEQGNYLSAGSWNDEGPVGSDGPEDDFGPIADAFERTYLPST